MKTNKNVTEPLAKCQWFLLCARPAVTTRKHWIAGDVPCCERCAARVDRERNDEQGFPGGTER